MEEKKILVNEEMQDFDSANNVKQNNKKSNGVTIVLVLLLLILAGVLIYVFLIKPKSDEGSDNDRTQPTIVILTNAEALNVVKEKIELANNFFGDFISSSECTDSIEDGFCYYDTVNNFNSKFYSIYSKNMAYVDVFSDSQPFAPYIKTRDSKVYVKNNCTEGSGDKSLKGDYEIKSITSDTIIAKYVILDTDPVTGNTSSEDEEVKLVKEDNNWKIVYTILIGRCNALYGVGK